AVATSAAVRSRSPAPTTTENPAACAIFASTLSPDVHNTAVKDRMHSPQSFPVEASVTAAVMPIALVLQNLGRALLWRGRVISTLRKVIWSMDKTTWLRCLSPDTGGC